MMMQSGYATDMTEITPPSAAVHAPCATDAPAWHLSCTAWTPTPDRSGQLGVADLVLAPSGLMLFGARVVRLQSGHIHVLAPRHKSRPTFRIADDAAWLRFSAAALEAVQAAYPNALPPDHPIPATPPAPILAPANHRTDR